MQYKGVDAEKVLCKVEARTSKRVDRVVKRCAKVTVKAVPYKIRIRWILTTKDLSTVLPSKAEKRKATTNRIENLHSGFEDQIIGKNAGDEFEVNVKFRKIIITKTLRKRCGI